MCQRRTSARENHQVHLQITVLLFSRSFSAESLSQDNRGRTGSLFPDILPLLRPLLITLLLISVPQVLLPRDRLPHDIFQIGVREHAPVLLPPGRDEPAGAGEPHSLVRGAPGPPPSPGILKVYDYLTSAKGREEPHCRNSGRVRLLFPLSVFSFLFTLLSSFVNSLRSLSLEEIFPKALNGLSWLLLLLPLGLIIF